MSGHIGSGSCGCEDCEAAVSPGAYLATLLDFVLKHVRNRNAPIDISWLEEWLGQPLASLPLDCPGIESPVRRARLGVEIVRNYLGPRPLFEPALEAGLADGETACRQAAYEAMLRSLGTGLDEIRLARTAAGEERSRLAERLGFTLTLAAAGAARHDELDQLYLDPAPDADAAHRLTDDALERLFGLASTSRGPLSLGVLDEDDLGQFRHWRFDGASWDVNTDRDGVIHLKLLELMPGLYGVHAYSDAAGTEPVASGETGSATGEIRLIPERGIGITGTVHIAYQADRIELRLQAIPLVMAWRLRRLQDLWKQADGGAEPAAATLPAPPLVDPQVIGFGDLRAGRAGTPAFDLLAARQAWLAAELAALQSARTGAATQLAGLEAAIALAFDPADVGDLDALAASRAEGHRIGAGLASLRLSVGAFDHLMRTLALLRAGEELDGPDWALVELTLLAVRKLGKFEDWRAEEASVGLSFSPKWFRAGDPAAAPLLATDPGQAAWLSTYLVRRRLLETLAARAAQAEQVASALADSVGAAEELVLPVLRQYLVNASDAEGADDDARAEWLGRRLLVDLRVAGSQLTTRCEQAIESLQELLFALRTGQLAMDRPTGAAPLKSLSALRRGPNQVELFAHDADDKLWHRVWDGRWRAWHPRALLPGGRTINDSEPSPPRALIDDDGGYELYVRGVDRHLWCRRSADGWNGWTLADQSLELLGSPAVRRAEDGAIEIYAIRSGDLAAVRLRKAGDTWGAWEEIGAASHRSPAVASSAAGRTDLCLGHDVAIAFQPFHRWWDGTAWQDFDLPGSLFSDPVMVSSQAGRLELFQNYAGKLHQLTYQGTWAGWVDLDAGEPAGSPLMVGAPSVLSDGDGGLELFALRGQTVWRRTFSAGAWEAWAALPAIELSLAAPDFDETWAWLGSYASWRSACFVRLYPENLLLPSLVSRRTPAFETLIEASRPTPGIDAAAVPRLAAAYSTYLADISSLEVEASCEARSRVTTFLPGKPPTTKTRSLCFMFGRTPLKGELYWSAYDPGDRTGYAQGFWRKISLQAEGQTGRGPRATSIIGALPWEDSDLDRHHIHLFFAAREGGVMRLYMIRYDLHRHGEDAAWDAPQPFDDLPPHYYTGQPLSLAQLSVVPVQANGFWEPPRLALNDSQLNGDVYVRGLNAKGDGWEPGAWPAFKVKLRYNKSPGVFDDAARGLSAAIRNDQVTTIVYAANHGSGSQRYVFSYGPGAAATAAHVSDMDSVFLGAIPGGGGAGGFLFYMDNGQPVYRKILPKPAPSENWPQLRPVYIASAEMKRIARHAGSYAPSFLVASPGGTRNHAYRFQVATGGEELVGSARLAVTPVLDGVTEVPTALSPELAQIRRNQIRNVYAKNVAGSASILAYLKEAYCLVPLQLGLACQAGDDHVAALDLYATVYDYRAAPGKRYIDYGLEVDAGLPDTGLFQHPEDWLSDPLNPHAIALTRRNAYLRFVLMTMIGCCNEAGDAFFAIDTSESLARARLMYGLALDLADQPELRQHLGVCEALIAQLRIAPGQTVPPEVAAALGEIADKLTLGKVGGGPNALSWLDEMASSLASASNWSNTLDLIEALTVKALKEVPVAPTPARLIAGQAARIDHAHAGLIADPAVETAMAKASAFAMARAAEIVGGGA